MAMASTQRICSWSPDCLAISPTWLLGAFSIVRCPPGYSELFLLYVALQTSAALYTMALFYVIAWVSQIQGTGNTYPECMYVLRSTAWDPLSDTPIVLVYSPCLTDYSSSPREHRLSRRSQSRRMAPKVQEDFKPQGCHCMARDRVAEPG